MMHQASIHNDFQGEPMRLGLSVVIVLLATCFAHCSLAADSTPTAIATRDVQPYVAEAIKHYNRGVELHQAGFLNEAIVEYKAAIAADNRLEEAYSNLGVIYAAQRNYPKAKDAFSEALKLKPNRPTTLNGLGTVLYAQGQIEEATEKWKEALAVDPRFSSAYYNMGNAYESEKNLLQAKACYMKALVVMPTMADAYFRLGTIMNKEHHYPQSIILLKKAIELDPEGEFVREAKHSLYFMENRFEKGKVKGLQLHNAHARH